MKKAWRIFLIMLIALLGFALTPPGGRYFEIAKNLDIFATVYREVNEYYVDEINPTQLMNKGINGMLQDLDPYTNYISEDMIEDFRTANTGQYAGIGASTITLNGRIFVTMVYEGFSAYKNGLRIGDEILAIDGVPVKGLSEERIEQLMKGQLKSRVGLQVKRLGSSDPLELVFEREKIKIPNVPYSNMLTDEVGYIKFTEFTPDGYKNVRKALMALMRQGADGIVLDLRNNLGGLLNEAVDITNLFIPEGELVVETRGKLANNNYTYKTRNTPLAPDLKLTVLVNHMSASASEIVAGTLQDYDRAVIIGNKTYGKGLVQNARDLPYNGKVKITIAKYYTPSGRCIQAIDYSHKQNGRAVQLPDSLKKAFHTRNGRLVYDGGGIDPEIVIEDKLTGGIVKKLYEDGYLYMFARQYASRHETIPPPESFNLNDADYADFVNWVIDTGFTYSNPLLKDFEQLQQHLPDSTTAMLVTRLGENLQIDLQEELNHYRPDLQRLLEKEIAAFYYLWPGEVAAGLADDPYVQAALEVLQDPQRYQALLAGPQSE